MGYTTRLILCVIFAAAIIGIALQYIPTISVRSPLRQNKLSEAQNLPAPTQDKTKEIPTQQSERKRLPPNTPIKRKNPTPSNPLPDTLYAFQLPYAPNVAYLVYQGYMTESTHRGIHALDIAMPEGTPILASREGTVHRAVDTLVYNPIMGTGVERYRDMNNGIEILHADNTLTLYGHIQNGSSRVKVGDKVNVGQELALSGTSGGPHLHFSIYLKDGNKWRTFAFLLATKSNPMGEIPQNGDYPMRPISLLKYPSNILKKIEILDLKNNPQDHFGQDDRLRVVVQFKHAIDFPVQVFLNRPNARTIEKTVTWSEYKNAVWVDTKAGDLKYHAGKWIVEVKIEDQLLDTATFMVKKPTYK
jgi:murein DD-endopeptidase MepM/ murein hydrolase activator NlpD